MFGGDFGLPPRPRYGRRSTGGAPPVVYLCHAVAPRRSSCRIALNSSSAWSVWFLASCPHALLLTAPRHPKRTDETPPQHLTDMTP